MDDKPETERILHDPRETIDSKIESLLIAQQDAYESRNFERVERIRKEIQALWELQDQGYR